MPSLTGKEQMKEVSIVVVKGFFLLLFVVAVFKIGGRLVDDAALHDIRMEAAKMDLINLCRKLEHQGGTTSYSTQQTCREHGIELKINTIPGYIVEKPGG